MTAVPRRTQWQPRTRANGLLGPQYSASRHTTPQSATLGLHPVIHVPNYMDHYSFTDPLRDGWLSCPCWLTDSGRLNRKVVTHSASSLAQDRESSPTETSVLTTMLRRQLHTTLALFTVCHTALREYIIFARISYAQLFIYFRVVGSRFHHRSYRYFWFDAQLPRGTERECSFSYKTFKEQGSTFLCQERHTA